MAATAPSSENHLAAIIPSKGASPEVSQRSTPTPGPDEVVVEVKAIALNPVDYIQLHLGAFLGAYPATFGNDFSGVVIAKGSNVSDDLQPGTRVAAFASAYFLNGAPDYGAFQQGVLILASSVAPIPATVSFKEASMLPLAALTAWCGFYHLGVPRNATFTPADKKGLLIWGGGSGVGSVVIQAAKLMGFVTYVTASEKHHAYLKELGATRLFDYKDANIVGNIVKAAKDDGVAIQLAQHVTGSLKDTLAIMEKVKGEGEATVAHAPPLAPDAPKSDGIEVKFVMPPTDPAEREEFVHFIYRTWMKEKLEKGELVPSPKIQVIEGGLSSIEKGLDEWKKGVSCKKLVLEI